MNLLWLAVLLGSTPWVIFSAIDTSGVPVEIIATILGVGLTAIIGAIIKWHKTRKDRLCLIQADVEDMKKAVWRLNKTLIIVAKIMDATLEKTHPELRADLEEIASELLSTQEDNA